MNAGDVYAQLNGRISLIIDGAPARVEIPSTVVLVFEQHKSYEMVPSILKKIETVLSSKSLINS